MSTTVYLGIEESINSYSEVVIINSNSRHDNPQIAYNKVANILEKHADQFDLIFLKTDSGLRGNISATLKAGIDVLQETLAFVPAYPSVNRKTIDGTHYINGQLLQHSIFKNDLSRLSSSHVIDIINQDYQVPAQLIGKNEVYSYLVQGQGKNLVNVYDCDSLSHLESIVKTLQTKGRLTFIAGCADLAHIISE
ncbi:four-carbon acid sugar kinase family protein [Gracilibacillus timonensis]|uniref:four-carbon acid sugar kinase family protein n=1 Tax=Gracilibacillus timonensis TaxID=1816696 RepID=UPI00098E8B4C|nr:four-carbon acid sugar kinase family protein [Gracilibacillus timonensis]